MHHTPKPVPTPSALSKWDDPLSIFSSGHLFIDPLRGLQPTDPLIKMIIWIKDQMCKFFNVLMAFWRLCGVGLSRAVSID